MHTDAIRLWRIMFIVDARDWAALGVFFEIGEEPILFENRWFGPFENG